VVALDGVAFWLNVMLFGSAGVSLIAAGTGMLRSRLFPQWLCWIGLVAGVAAAVGCVLTAATAGKSAAGAGDAVTGVAAVAMWVWMLVTGVLLWRETAQPPSRVG
jgi:hypothetical protein